MNRTLVPHLSKDVYLIRGILRGAIYDLRYGNVYSINRSACEILDHQREDSKYWERLIQMGIAEWHTDNGEPITSLTAVPFKPTSLQFVWFEIAGASCNERCLHCYAEGGTICRTRSGSRSDLGKLSYSEWIGLVKSSYELGCRQCQFIGGEPFLYRGANGENVLDLAKFAKDLGYEFIEVFTNGTLLTNEKIDKIKELGLHVAISIYSHLPLVHDRITQTPGSHARTMRSLSRLHKLGIPCRVALVMMSHNQDTIEETRNKFCQMGFDSIKVDVVRPTGRGKDSLSLTDGKHKEYALATAPNFHAARQFVIQNVHENSCLAGKITITDDGDVLPCIFGRDWVLGNVRTGNLKKIIGAELTHKLWNFSKDSVLVCRDCEFRYVCFDCRPLAYGVNKTVNAPPPRCTYNPYTGEWTKGVWRLDLDGNPVYSESLEEKSQS